MKLICIVTLSSCLGMLSSCMKVGPDYKRPTIHLPDTWTTSIQTDNQSSITGSQRWWRKFNDPVLNKLITISRKANPNIRIARARITESWYQRSVLASAWYPHSDINARDAHGLGTWDESGVNWDPGSSREQLAQLNVGWELDFFGKTKRQVESATAEYEAKIEGWRDATVFINSEVALHYIAYRTLEQRLTAAIQATKNYQSIRDMIAQRVEDGLANQLEFHEAKARLKTSEAEIPRIQQEKAVVKNRLAALLAVQPGNIGPMLAAHQKIPTPPSSICTGFPAELLRSRPDVRRSERKIAAQSARIGVATANLYPQLSLSGAITYEYLLQGISVATLRRTLGLGPNLRWRIFNACGDRHRIKEQESKLTQAITTYESTVINAVTQVENSMSRLHYTKKRLNILKEAADEHQRAADLMKEAYLAGQVDLRRLLNAQQDFIKTKDESIATAGRRAAHSVRLFKALGGGELPQPRKQDKAN
ncbi:MAG: efflux transporter outer membrane subunit [Verrucomicrobiae bacterium]|nr:efflux transporter outer membrane subunit [Verrucomicrobiae bacterium]NNJ43596.1 efflux transporter outer membrane subunit [Akkermansiaceae bacterium]